MPRDMPSTTREFAQLEESMAHERKCVPSRAPRRSGRVRFHFRPALSRAPGDHHPTDLDIPFSRMSIGVARLSAHAASIRAERIDVEASAVAASETAKIMARVGAGEEASKKGDDDDFVWPVLGTKLPTHRRRHVKHWKETRFAPEPLS